MSGASESAVPMPSAVGIAAFGLHVAERSLRFISVGARREDVDGGTQQVEANAVDELFERLIMAGRPTPERNCRKIKCMANRCGSSKDVARENPRLPCPPVVIQKEDLTLWVMLRVAKLPRDHRFTLGDRLIGACLSVLHDLVHAAFSRDKAGLLTHASRTLTLPLGTVKSRLRLALQKLRSALHEDFDLDG